MHVAETHQSRQHVCLEDTRPSTEDSYLLVKRTTHIVFVSSCFVKVHFITSILFFLTSCSCVANITNMLNLWTSESFFRTFNLIQFSSLIYLEYISCNNIQYNWIWRRFCLTSLLCTSGYFLGLLFSSMCKTLQLGWQAGVLFYNFWLLDPPHNPLPTAPWLLTAMHTNQFTVCLNSVTCTSFCTGEYMCNSESWSESSERANFLF